MRLSAAVAALPWLALPALLTAQGFADCLSGLPGEGSVPGFNVMEGSTVSGRLGQKASYDAYDGAVEAMRKQGIVAFAQRMYKNAATGQFITADIYQLATVSAARKLYEGKLAGYRKAKPLTKYTSIRDQAAVGTVNAFTVGLCVRGGYVCEISLTRANSARGRGLAKSFLQTVSQRLGAGRSK